MKLDAKAMKDRLDLIGFLRDRYGITFNQKGWGRCLFADLHEHGDTHPSLQLHKEGRAVKCWAGDHLDGWADCFQVVMLKERVLFPEALQRCAAYLGLDPPPSGRPMRQILRCFQWVDAAGQVAWHLRWEPGKPRFTWAQDQDNEHPGLGACEPTVYRLREVDAAETIILVEGERDADTLNAWLTALGRTDAVATTPAYGGSDVKPAYLAPLHGKARVYLSGDRDKVGRMFLQQCETLLQHHVNSLCVLTVPDGFKDWTEWAEGGGTAEQFAALLAAAPVWHPRSQHGAGALDGDADIVRLAQLPPLEYDRCRQQEAKRLGVKVSTLDRAVLTRRKSGHRAAQGKGHAFYLADIEPSAETVEGTTLLEDLIRTIRHYVVVSDPAALAIALWILRAYAHDRFEVNPRLALLSPEKRCGKTTVLEILFHLTPRALLASNITVAAIFRVIDAERPTLLLDELDSFGEAQDELRGILNSGHTRTAAQVIRTVGDEHEPRAFSTWCPMALAAIGHLSSTLEDRSIVVPMKRRAPSEHVTGLRQSGAGAQAAKTAFRALARRSARWVLDHGSALQTTIPRIPPGLHDRAADNWSPLLAIAAVLGEEILPRAQAAALTLSGHVTASNESSGIQLLDDIHALFLEAEIEQLASQDLCDRLALLEERPWGEWKRGKPLSPNQLARLLRPFAVTSRNVRLPDGRVVKGYTCADLQDAFTRYLPTETDSAFSNRYTATRRFQSDDEPLFQSATEEACSGSENAMNPAPDAGCSAVALQNSESREEEVLFEEHDAT